MIVCPLHAHYSSDHLTDVAAEMLVRGAPMLHAHHDLETDAILLREGTHRIRAAWLLGLAPQIVLVPWWRSRPALVRARIAAKRRGLVFPVVVLLRGV